MKKLTAIILAMLTICMLFTACNEKSDDTTTVIKSDGSNHASNGYLLSAFEERKVRIYAPETGYSMIYCNQPGCKHEQYSENNIAPSCTAVFPEAGTPIGAFFYNDRMYMFGWDESLLNTVIYKGRLDGTEKKKLGVLENAAIISSQDMMINNDVLYFMAEGRSFDGKKTVIKSVIASMDLDSGEGKVVYEVGESRHGVISPYKGDVGKDYFFYVASDPETQELISESRTTDKEFWKTLPDGYGRLHCVNVHTGEDKELFQSGFSESYFPILVHIGNTFFYSHNVNDENGNNLISEIREYNAETGEDKPCRFGDVSVMWLFGNKIYYGLNASNEASVNYVYDVK
ncbi:MAG: hypothetical protein E7491_03590, partial [Ruminococcaceae bacterium]|nr:hypothetical protein [Oscillospiraceae bacterium]